MRLAFIALSTLAAAAPSLAAAPTIEAQLASPADGRIITRSGAWACTDAGCTTRSAESRPAVMCELLAKEAGRIETFAVDGVAFDADKLAKCNRKAR